MRKKQPSSDKFRLQKRLHDDNRPAKNAIL